LEHDGLRFFNPLHQQILEEYKAHSADETFSSERFFLYHPNAQISQLTADLVTEKYMESKVHSRVRKTISDVERLNELGQRLIFEYKNSIILDLRKDLQIRMKLAQEQDNIQLINELMDEMKNLDHLRKQLSKNLGERVIEKYL